MNQDQNRLGLELAKEFALATEDRGRERREGESWEDYIKRLHADGLIDESDYAEQEEPCREGGQAYDPKRDGYGRFRKSKYHAPKGLRKVKAKLKKESQRRNRK